MVKLVALLTLGFLGMMPNAVRDGQFTVPMHTVGSSTVPLNSCLIGGYPMNEGTGLTLHDVSGNHNDATISSSGAVTWQSNTGFAGTTPYWNGTGYALASSTTLTNFTRTSPFSVAVWFYQEASVGTEGTFVGTLNASANDQGWALEVSPDLGVMVPLIFMLNSYPSNALYIHGDTSTPFSSSALHYYVATTDGTGTAAGTHMYMDGTLLSSPDVILNSLTSTIANGLPARFGARNDGSAEFIGPMADVSIYNCAILSTDITTYYGRGPQIN